MTCFDIICDKFDKIYVLTLSHRKDRQIAIMKQLHALGYDDNNIKHIKKLQMIYTTEWKYNGIICNALNNHFHYQCFTKANEYDCTRNHYNIIKTAYDLGYENILIIEDDMRFLNVDMLIGFFEEFPQDYSMVQCAGFSTNTVFKQVNEKYYTGLKYIQDMPVNLWTTGMYALSISGMEYYINFMNDHIGVADLPLYHHPSTKYYFTTIPLAIQADKTTCPSDIRNSQNDQIDYQTQNMYESIDKSIYMSYI